jgi:hypothetical protein
LHRVLLSALSALLLLSACKVERTPRKYYTGREPAAVERQHAEEEIRARVSALGQALERGDETGALLALAPAPEVYAIGPEGGATVVGPEGVVEMVRELTREAPASAELQDLRVTLGPRARIGWFAAVVRVQPSDTAGAAEDFLRMSGVYLRSEGEWRLVQAHLSHPPTSPAPAQPNPPADSAAPRDSRGRGGA